MPAQPLTEAQIRSIIRDHPAIFAEIASIDAVDAGTVSTRVTEIVSRHPELVHAIVAAGLGCTIEAAQRMNFMAWLALFQIVHLTQQSLPPERILGAAFEELAALILPGSDVQ